MIRRSSGSTSANSISATPRSSARDWRLDPNTLHGSVPLLIYQRYRSPATAVTISEDFHAKSCDLLTHLILPRARRIANPRKAWATHPFGGPGARLGRWQCLGAAPERVYRPRRPPAPGQDHDPDREADDDPPSVTVALSRGRPHRKR